MTCLLGEKIKKLRKEKGLNAEKLSRKIGVNKGYITHIEHKIVKNPSVKKIACVAKELNVTIDYLLDDNTTEMNPENESRVFYRKMGDLSQDAQKKLMQIVDVWRNS